MNRLLRWLPALFVMAVLFFFSSLPSASLPDYGLWDRLVKKSGHMTGYALLLLAYWYGLGCHPRRGGLAWLLALAYAFTDEFHQSFTPGRNASLTDVLLFDNLGALLGWGAGWLWLRCCRSGRTPL